MRKLVKPCSYDPFGSVSVFDIDRVNDFGELFCVASGALNSTDPNFINGSEWYWQKYLKENKKISKKG